MSRSSSDLIRSLLPKLLDQYKLDGNKLGKRDPGDETDPTRIITQSYDTQNRWIGRAIDADGEGTPEHIDRMAYDGDQIVLKFSSNTGEDVVPNELSHRYL